MARIENLWQSMIMGPLGQLNWFTINPFRPNIGSSSLQHCYRLCNLYDRRRLAGSVPAVNRLNDFPNASINDVWTVDSWRRWNVSLGLELIFSTFTTILEDNFLKNWHIGFT